MESCYLNYGPLSRCCSGESIKTYRWFSSIIQTSSLYSSSSSRRSDTVLLKFPLLSPEELSTLIPHLAAPSRPTRDSECVHPFAVQPEKSRTTQFWLSLFLTMSRLWNELPPISFPNLLVSTCLSFVSRGLNFKPYRPPWHFLLPS